MLLRMNSPSFLNPTLNFDRVLSDVFGAFEQTAPPQSFTPRVRPAMNLHEGADAFYLEAELPGVSMDQLQIDVADNTLTIACEAHADVPGSAEQKDGWTVHRAERFRGRFSRSVRLSAAIDSGKAQATLEDGVLRVTLPKAEVAKPRRIQVSSPKGPDAKNIG